MESAQFAKGQSVFTRRALLLIGVQTTAFGALGYRLYNLQMYEGEKYKKMAQKNQVSTRYLTPPRGRIVDRSSIEIATNKVNWRALIMPEETSDFEGTLKRFSDLIYLDDRNLERIAKEMKHKRRYVPVMLKSFLTWDEMAKIQLNAPTLPGVMIDVGTTRDYPFGPLLAHVVGYVAPPSEKDVAKDASLALPGMRIGRAGIEETQEPFLRGKAGSVEMEVNSVGRILAELNRNEGVPGDEIELTIDTRLQQSVKNLLGEEAASAVVMDCRNGEVVAMVSNPSFDPSLFDSGVSRAQWQEWSTDPRTPLINKAVTGVYPPGSTFKPAVALSALQAGSINPHDRVLCRGYIDVGGTRFHCWAKHGHGSVDLKAALKFSCDVYFYEIARKTGMENIKKGSEALGLATRLPIELPHSQVGLIPTPEWRKRHGHHWNGGDTIVSGIGQGFVHVTPLQLATYAARIATGRAVDPHLVRAVDGNVSDKEKPDYWPELPFPVQDLDVIRQGMYAVVNEARGTAPKARLNLPGIQMAGKTGSAQVRRVSRALRESGHFNSQNLPWEYRPHALFICYAPYDAPRYALSVVIEHGNAAAQVAAPMARDIMRETLLKDPASIKKQSENQFRKSKETPHAAQAGSSAHSDENNQDEKGYNKKEKAP
ncbi:penicillin-binding protein 2 [Entomobacter blattae]|uniref:penicillin-binding protein 2 n=1 Tax=Entomobacter blattae TaxID=2762277 RepID=UPI001EF0024D|nr:penicillin-binding protein 2 [Entomobacter blattae]